MTTLDMHQMHDQPDEQRYLCGKVPPLRRCVSVDGCSSRHVTCYALRVVPTHVRGVQSIGVNLYTFGVALAPPPQC